MALLLVLVQPFQMMAAGSIRGDVDGDGNAGIGDVTHHQPTWTSMVTRALAT